MKFKFSLLFFRCLVALFFVFSAPFCVCASEDKKQLENNFSQTENIGEEDDLLYNYAKKLLDNEEFLSKTLLVCRLIGSKLIKEDEAKEIIARLEKNKDVDWVFQAGKTIKAIQAGKTIQVSKATKEEGLVYFTPVELFEKLTKDYLFSEKEALEAIQNMKIDLEQVLIKEIINTVNYLNCSKSNLIDEIINKYYVINGFGVSSINDIISRLEKEGKLDFKEIAYKAALSCLNDENCTEQYIIVSLTLGRFSNEEIDFAISKIKEEIENEKAN